MKVTRRLAGKLYAVVGPLWLVAIAVIVLRLITLVVAG